MRQDRIIKSKLTFSMHFLSILPLFSIAVAGLSQPARDPFKVCTVPAAGSETIDDAPAVLKAFSDCGHGGKILFQNTTYHINSVMNTTGLENCEVDLRGTLLVKQSDEIY